MNTKSQMSLKSQMSIESRIFHTIHNTAKVVGINDYQLQGMREDVDVFIKALVIAFEQDKASAWESEPFDVFDFFFNSQYWLEGCPIALNKQEAFDAIAERFIIEYRNQRGYLIQARGQSFN